jgi:DNA helicase HerA-like ATPase
VSHPPGIRDQVASEVARAGSPWQADSVYEGAIGRTMFDSPSSEDNTVTVLMPAEEIGRLPAQALVRIRSRSAETGGDGRIYLGAVVAGPYAEPDGLRADAPIVVTTTVRGAQFLPRYHGRVQVAILAEEVDGIPEPPRYRPLPNSPVFALSDEETSRHLGLLQENPIRLGLAVGYSALEVQAPARRKSVLPRHLAVLGTTGGGKSTTVSRLVAEFSAQKLATILIDTEGEYTTIGSPTEDPAMVRLLGRMGATPQGVPGVKVHHLVGRSTTAAGDVSRSQFRLDLSSLSPYAISEIMELTEAQNDRFFKAYDVARLALRDAGIFPQANSQSEQARAIELDDMVEGVPRLTIAILLDIVHAFVARLSKGTWEPATPAFHNTGTRKQVEGHVNAVDTSHPTSWNLLRSKLNALHRLNIFDNPRADALPYAQMLQPGATSIIDLSDTDSSILNNLVIANLLGGVRAAQEAAYTEAERAGRAPTPVMVIIEEAHEFLSSERISKMETLFEQVARLARRGRKRWLGLVFVTQLPDHLPDEVLGLVNNFILHKIADGNVINRLKRSVGGIDDGLWRRVPNLAPGQAVVSLTSMSRPLLVTIHPTPCKLRMVE